MFIFINSNGAETVNWEAGEIPGETLCTLVASVDAFLPPIPIGGS